MTLASTNGSIKGLISDIQHNDTQLTLCHYAECCCAECRDLFIVMLNIIMLSVFMLGVFMLSVFKLSVFMLSVFMLNDVILAPMYTPCLSFQYDKLSDTPYPGMAKAMFVLFQILIPILLLV
jgi:hypothetical protein